MSSHLKCLGRANCGWVDGGQYVCHCFEPVKKNSLEEIKELVSSVLARFDSVRTENENIMLSVLNKIKKVVEK